MKAIKIAFSLLVLVWGCSCALTEPIPSKPATEPEWTIQKENYESLKTGAGSIEISLQSQRLILKDPQGRHALETDCSTGIPGKETPKGTFRIKEMIVDKRSNKYGKYVSKTTGEVVVEKSWEVSTRPPGTKYLGIPMPYWMRLTWGGVGIHVGKFPRGYRSSFGCIRIPEEIQPYIYAKSRRGMKVVISD